MKARKYTLIFIAIVTIVAMLAFGSCNRPETYTVSYNPNGGTGTMTAQTFTEGEAQSLTRNAFTYDGYTFTGWNTMQDGNGASYTDGQTITVNSDMTLYAQWSSHKYVDLGLPSGTKWATCNVGATTPEGSGDYFAWGETTTKETYNWSTYRYCNGDYNTLTKYSNNAEYGNNGFTDALTTIEASDDAATANWGAGWRMPTREEMVELYSNCTHEWTTQNGVIGRKFTGPNGNSVFLPAAGGRDGSSLHYDGSYGGYWSSSLNSDDPNYARVLNFDSGDCYTDIGERYYGLSVRPVYVSAQN